MNYRVSTFSFALAAVAWTSAASAAIDPWRGGYPEYMPDTVALHDRLHDHPGDDESTPSADDGKTPPLPVSTAQPHLSRDLQRLNRNGWVLLEFMVGKDGEPFDIEIVAQDYQEIFGRTAIQAVRRWRFKPAMLNGEPIEESVVLPMLFRRATCGYEIPSLHEASLASPFELPVEAVDGLEHADLVFLPIFDDLFGSPAGTYIHAQKWVRGDIIPLNTEGMNNELAMLRPKEGASPMDVQPASARIARVIPAGLSGESALFTDALGRTLILVYADRKAVIGGESVIGNTVLHHRIDLPGAGFYWVELRQGADGQHESVVLTDVEQPRITLEKS